MTSSKFFLADSVWRPNLPLTGDINMHAINQNESPGGPSESRGETGIDGKTRGSPVHPSANCSRREVLGTMLAAGGAVLSLGDLQTPLSGAESGAATQAYGAGVPPLDAELAEVVKVPSVCDYFWEDFGALQHSKIKPWDLTPEQLASAGLTRETWTLDVVFEKDPLLGQPRLSTADGTTTTTG